MYVLTLGWKKTENVQCVRYVILMKTRPSPFPVMMLMGVACFYVIWYRVVYAICTFHFYGSYCIMYACVSQPNTVFIQIFSYVVTIPEKFGSLRPTSLFVAGGFFGEGHTSRETLLANAC